MTNRGFNEILIFVTGSTPQIVTETIYALAIKNPPIIPHKLYFITTSKGRELIQKKLLQGNILQRLADELNISLPPIDEDSFIVAKDAQGTEIDDIRSESENTTIGDIITSFIREQASDSTNRLHCSLAGGRKTMSFYIGAALQLFGRSWDKLYHVLVSPEFESNPHFFFKPKKDTDIECKLPDGTVRNLNTKDAQISLVELPFIRLRHKLNLQKKGFSELVEEGQREIDIAMMQPEIKVNLSYRTIHIGDKLIELVPFELFIYTVFLRQKTNKCKHPNRQYCSECTDCFQSIHEILSRPALEEFIGDYEKIYGGQPFKTSELINRHNEGIPPEIMRTNISKIKSNIKSTLNDETLLPYYTITSIKIYGNTKYGLRIEKGKITIE